MSMELGNLGKLIKEKTATPEMEEGKRMGSRGGEE